MLFSVKRKTEYENRYHKNMGRIKVRVTKVYLTFIGIPYKLMHHYRETYHGKVKDYTACDLAKK